MLTIDKQIYNIGTKYNTAIKYNVNYDRRAILDYACGIHINELLKEKYPLNIEQISKLTVLLNNLIIL